MAQCTNPTCKKEVGCGCNLKAGLCAKCFLEKTNKEAKEASEAAKKYDVTK